MDTLSEIKRQIQTIAGRGGLLSFTARVVSVDGETCTIDIDGLRLSDVRLRPVTGGNTQNRLLVVPKEGSHVTVIDHSGGSLTDVVVVSVAEAESIVINGGNLGGLVKIGELHKRLKALENAFNNHTHTITVVGAAPASAGVPPTATEFPPTGSNQFQSDCSGYEDDKVKH